MKQALTIAGSDSGGGAGIEADIKTFHAHGVYGAVALTAVTAQNTREVRASFEIPPDIVRSQIEAVLDDLEISAVKTGMLSSAAIVEVVASVLAKRKVGALVVDPVIVSKSGYPLLEQDALALLKKRLLPLALIVTPNLSEAEALAETKITGRRQMEEAAASIHSLGPRFVLVKGGHSPFDPACDLLFDGREFRRFPGKFIPGAGTHGTGCTLSAAIAARLARGETVEEAIEKAKAYIARAIAAAPPIGKGNSPAHHFYFLGGDDVPI